MGTCENCGRALDPSWKFCIHCGTPIALAAPSSPVASGPAASAPANEMPADIPAAIRPDEPAEKRKSKLDVSLLVGIALAAAGVILIVYLTIAILGPHG